MSESQIDLNLKNLINYMDHHPFGMLDRDQRTTLTIPKKLTNQKRDLNNNLKEQNIINSKISPSRNHEIKILFKTIKNQHNDIKNRCNLINNNLKKIKMNTKMNSIKSDVLLPKELNSQCRNENDKNLVNLKSKTLLRKLALRDVKIFKKDNFSNNYPTMMMTAFRKRTKLDILFVLTCVWLIVLQTAQAIPIPIMASANGQQNDVEFCSKAHDALDKIYRQANIAYSENLNQLNNYTIAIHNERNESLHERWRKAQYQELSRITELNFDNYVDGGDQPFLSDLIARLQSEPLSERIHHELRILHRRLYILDKAFDRVLNDHRSNETELTNRFSDERYYHMCQYFINQRSYIKALINEVKASMHELHVSVPNGLDLMLGPNETAMELRDWFVARENLKLHHYILKVYDVLLEICNNRNF